MPPALKSGLYRFFFYAGDRDAPPHIHVEHENKTAKFWLDPVRLEHSAGFSRKELNRIQKIVAENSENVLRSWYAYFSD